MERSYSFTLGSSFKPLSLQEMIMPLAMYKDAYDKDEAAYLSLTEKADKFKLLASTLEDGSKAKAIYDGYANELQKQADDFAHNGRTRANAAGLLSLKRRYTGEIGALEQAVNARKAQIDEQRKIYQQDPTRLFSRNAASTSLDAYLDNPDLDYKSYSGALLAKQVGDQASTIAKNLISYSQGQPLDEYTNTWIQQSGLRPEQVAAALSNPGSPEGNAVLNSIVKGVVASSGIEDWADPATLKQAYNWAGQGLWSAVGDQKVGQYNNFEAQLRAKEASQNRLADAAMARQLALQQAALQASQSSQASGLAVNRVNVFSPKEKDAMDDAIKKFSKYFTTDSNGQVRMTAEGLREYNKPVSSGGVFGSVKDDLLNFKYFIDSLGGAEYAKKRQVGNLGNLWVKYKNSKDKYDSTKRTEYKYTFDGSEEQKAAMAAIQLALGEDDLHEVEYDPETKKYKRTSGTLSLSELNDGHHDVLATNYGPYGSTVFVRDKEGRTKRYELPVGINSTAETNRDRILRAAQELQEAIVKGTRTDASGNEVPITEEEMQLLNQQYEYLLQQATLYHSQLWTTNKTKPQEFGTFSY